MAVGPEPLPDLVDGAGGGRPSPGPNSGRRQGSAAAPAGGARPDTVTPSRRTPGAGSTSSRSPRATATMAGRPRRAGAGAVDERVMVAKTPKRTLSVTVRPARPWARSREATASAMRTTSTASSSRSSRSLAERLLVADRLERPVGLDRRGRRCRGPAGGGGGRWPCRGWDERRLVERRPGRPTVRTPSRASRSRVAGPTPHSALRPAAGGGRPAPRPAPRPRRRARGRMPSAGGRGLGRLRGQLGQQLGRGDADAAGQAELVGDPPADGGGDLGAGPEQPRGARSRRGRPRRGRSPSTSGVNARKMAWTCAAHLLVGGVVAGQEDAVGTAPAGARPSAWPSGRRNGGPRRTPPPRRPGGRCRRRRPAGRPARAGAAARRHEEGVHVDVEDRARPLTALTGSSSSSRTTTPERRRSSRTRPPRHQGQSLDHDAARHLRRALARGRRRRSGPRRHWPPPGARAR